MKTASKRKIQIIVDVLMTAVLLVLMSYSIAGELIHEILGISLFILFTAHHIFSLNFTKALFKGKITPTKIIKIICDILMVIFMLIMLLSALSVSKYVFAFLGINFLSALARNAHTFGAYWLFALISIHIGFHLDFMLEKPMKNNYGKMKPIVLAYSYILALMLCMAGSLAIMYKFNNWTLNFMTIGGVLFVISDLILSGTYFSEGKERPVDIITNTVTYYAAQFFIAFSLLMLIV